MSDECYLKDRCWKYHNSDAECKHQNIYCPKLFRMDYLYNESLMSSKQRIHIPLHIDEDGTDREAFNQLKLIEQNIEKFVESGANLYLHSPFCGNGKTAWSLRLLQAYIEKIWFKSDLTCRVLFVNVPRYLLALKDSISNTNEYAEHIKKNIFQANLVVFDDLATKDTTIFETEHLLSVIDTRINNNLSNLFTSNINPEDLSKAIGPRLASRVVNLSTVITLQGSDKRGINY